MIPAKTFGIVSLANKIVVMVLLGVSLVIGALAIFGSDGRKYFDRASEEIQELYAPLFGMEYGFLAITVISFLLCLGSSILICVGFQSKADNKKGFLIADIVLCTLAALFALAAGAMLAFAATGECNFKKTDDDNSRLEVPLKFTPDDIFAGKGLFGGSDSGGRSGRGGRPGRGGRSGGRSGSDNDGEYECEAGMIWKDCRKKICNNLWETVIKTAAALLAIVVGATGFCVPCAIAFKVHKKNPPVASTVMGYQQSGAYGGVATGPQVNPNPSYSSPPPHYDSHYGHGRNGGDPYGGGGGGPQMSPSQNPAGGYPPSEYPQGGYPQQGGNPQYAQQGGQY